jgi:putative lipoprotein (rSAM/lipoprotein system)
MSLKCRKIINNVLKGFSLTTAMFIFQACYGIPAAFPNALVEGRVVSNKDNQGIRGIKVSVGYYYYIDVNNFYSYSDSCTVTDHNGYFSFHTTLDERGAAMSDAVFFNDIDSTENGLYEDTRVQIEGADKVYINVILNEIEQDSASLQ